MPVFKNVVSYITLRNEYQADQESIKATSRSSLAAALLKSIETGRSAKFPALISTFAHTPDRIAHVIYKDAKHPRFILSKLSAVLSVSTLLLVGLIFFTPRAGHAHQPATNFESSSQLQAQVKLCHDLSYAAFLPFMNKNQSAPNMTLRTE